MPLARFKDLCIDAVDPAEMGRFWASALNLDHRRQPNGDSYLVGPTKAHTVWICGVPETKTVKHRVHLDIWGSSVAEMEALGAVVIDDSRSRWTVMADPEGGEFCLFPVDEPPAYRLYELMIDCVDHAAQSAWWASVIGGDRVVDEAGYSFLENGPNVPFDCIDFAPVPEPKTVKNRVHLDLTADSIEPLLDIGASVLRRPDEEISWYVMADPEANEFCVFT